MSRLIVKVESEMFRKNHMSFSRIIFCVLRFSNASARIRCSLLWSTFRCLCNETFASGGDMNYTNLIKLASIAALVALSTGCASTCGTCNNGGLFGRPVFQNQPVRSTIRSWFQGDNCDTCAPPTGQVLSPNVAPLCDTCNLGTQPTGGTVAPLYGSPTGGVQLGTPNVTTPQPGPATIGNGVTPPNL